MTWKSTSHGVGITRLWGKAKYLGRCTEIKGLFQRENKIDLALVEMLTSWKMELRRAGWPCDSWSSMSLVTGGLLGEKQAVACG